MKNEMKKFFQRYLYRGKEAEEIAETRMRSYNEITAKTIRIILPDPSSLTCILNEQLFRLIIGYIV